jgi:hypothetical protein
VNYVYLVYYDNGAAYPEDRQHGVDKVFAIEADAEAYANQMNQHISESEEENWTGWEPFYSVEKTIIL